MKRIVTASDDKTAKVWDAVTGRLLLTLKGHASPVTFASFSGDEQRIVTASEDGSALVWDAHIDEGTPCEILNKPPFSEPSERLMSLAEKLKDACRAASISKAKR